MDVFAPDFGFVAPANGSSVLVNQNIPGTTIGSTNNYIYGPGGIPRNPQSQGLASSLGQGAIAPNDGGVAVGAYAGALAAGCSAFGYHAQAKVYSALALGDQAAALAYRSIALGRCANAAGNNSIAIGTLAKATGSNSIAIGNGAISGSAADSISIGTRVSATGSKSVCIGNLSTASGTADIVIGYNNNISGFNVVAIGINIQTAQNNCVLLGTGAIPVAANSFVAGAPGLFQQGPILDVYFGQGPRVFLAGGTVMGAYTIHGEEAGGGATGGANTNLNRAGGNLNLAGGRSTGSGVGGSVNIQVCGSFGSNETLNSLATALSVAPGPTITMSGSTVMNGPLTVNNIGGNVNFHITGPAGTARALFFETAGSARWQISADGGAETGSNAGSGFGLYAYTDAGAYQDTVMYCYRAAGTTLTFYRNTQINGNLSVSGTITGSFAIPPLTNPVNLVGSGFLIYRITKNDGPTNNKYFEWFYNTSQAGIRFVNDAYNAAADIVRFNQTAGSQNPTSIDFFAPITAPNLGSGTYTPVHALGANTGAVSALSPFTWMQIGNVVHVAGVVTLSAAVAGNVSFTVSLPIASNLTNTGDLAGTCSFGNVNSRTGTITADFTNDRAFCVGATSGTDNVAVEFTYKVQ